MVLESTCSRIIANRSYQQQFRWFIGDGLGSYRLSFFWDWGGLGSFGNNGEGLGGDGKKIKQRGYGYL